MKKEADYTISPKMQLLCLQVFEYIESHPDTDKESVCQEFRWCPKPIIHLAIKFLYRERLVYLDDSFALTASPIDPKRIPALLKSITMYPGGAVCEHFKKESLRTPYVCNNDAIIYQELSLREYLRFKEFYDYQTHTLKPDTGYGYFARQFGAMLADDTGTKSTHIFVASTPGGSILGYVAISNLANYDGKATKTPIRNEQIYNINFIATRTEFENLGIATNLLSYAINHVQNSEDMRMLFYDPICEQSRKVMEKVFSNKNYEIINLDKLPPKDMFKYGYFVGYVIIPKENCQTTEIEFE